MQKGSHQTDEAKNKISVANKGKRFSPKTEFKKGQVPWNKGRHGLIRKKGRRPSPEEIDRLRRLSRNRLGRKNSPEHRANISQGLKGSHPHRTNEANRKRSQSMRKRLATDSNLRNQRIAQLTELNRSIQRREEVGKQAKAQWADVNFKSKTIKTILGALELKPDKAELRLQDILDRNFSNGWKYTGNDGVAPNGLVPDFTNINDNTRLIELFGTYWHSTKKVRRWHETELGRIMAFNSLGYRCLVIWEHELKDEQAVAAKIKQFMKRRS